MDTGLIEAEVHDKDFFAYERPTAAFHNVVLSEPAQRRMAVKVIAAVRPNMLFVLADETGVGYQQRMCGIFGFVAKPDAPLKAPLARTLLGDLFHLSEPRGQEASGLAIAGAGRIEVFKRGMAPGQMIRTTDYRRFLDNALADTAGSPLAAIGHCRLVTNGAEIVPSNNQPVLVKHSVGIHNGIVTNDAALRAAHPELVHDYDTDSEILFRLIDHHYAANGDLAAATSKSFAAIEGSASVAFLRNDVAVLGLATNLGSLFYASDPDSGLFFFASERFILSSFLARNGSRFGGAGWVSRQLEIGTGCTVGLGDARPEVFALNETATDKSRLTTVDAAKPYIISDVSNRVTKIKRCTRCILPATYPFIEFDANGVCQHCRQYEPLKLHGRVALEAELDKHRRSDGSPDCIVAFSGGRDSSYGLHLLKTEYGMNPIAYSYDWGMVTGIARRNQARMLGKLGVEHILRAADIPTKRRYIRKNIHAWLRRPHLGMVPLFMAGDKFFYDIGRNLRKELNLDLVIFCAGNELERTDFKGGFAGIRESQHGQRLFAFSTSNKINIARFYILQYLRNPAYLNESLFDSLHAFRSSFLGKDDFLYLFHFLDWDEETINRTLIGKYGWETAAHTDNTWRIGDGYTAFVNYLYYTLAGFSEFDTFRSIQIRKGLIDRDTALAMVSRDNQPNIQALYEFARQVGVNLEEVMARINTFEKRY